jgi:hypothetical protein
MGKNLDRIHKEKIECPRHILENNTKIYLEEIDYETVEQLKVFQDSVQWRNIDNTLMNRDLHKSKKFLGQVSDYVGYHIRDYEQVYLLGHDAV